MMRSFFLTMAILSFFSYNLIAQTNPYDTSGGVFVGDETEEKEEVLRSIRDDRKEVLLYGIESEVTEVIGLINQEKDDSYNEELLGILQETENTGLSESIYSLMSLFEDNRAEETALADLRPILDDFTYQAKRALAAITYLGEIKSAKAVDLFYDLAKKDEPALTGRVIYNLGKIGDPSRAEELLTLYDEYQGDETNDIAVNIIYAWGEMKYQSSFDTLLEIIEDTSASNTEREYAAVALGKLGDMNALEPLIHLYNDEGKNSIIRSFAISGLMFFDDSRVEELLLQALKRDSYWKIRVTACEGLSKMKSSQAVDILDFKMRRDTEMNVKKAAAKALGEIGIGDSKKYLLDYLSNESNGAEMRLTVLKSLLDNKISGTTEALNVIFDTHWDKKDTQLEFLKRSCQALSTTKWQELSTLYRRMLVHKDSYIKIYGIRGIKINDMDMLYQEVKDLDREGVNSLVRREVKSLD